MPEEKAAKSGYILLIEDDRGTCELEAQRLEPLGLELRKAYNAAEAKAALAQGAPVMMLLDYSLPDADALEFIAELKESAAEVPPFLLVTGRGDEAVAVAAMKAGACDYLVKDGFFLERLPAVTMKAINDAELRARLKDSEERLRVFFEYSNVGESITAPDGAMRPNPEFCRMLGYSQEELSALNWREITPAEDIPHTEKILAELTRGVRDSARFEKRYLRKDGGLLWGDVSVKAKRGAAGRLEYFITTIVDITGRKEAEANLALLGETIKASLNEIYVFDEATYKFRFLNRGALKNLGYPETEALALTPLDIKPDMSRDSFEKILAKLRSDELSTATFESRHRRKDGSLYPVEVHLQHEPANRVFLAVVNDITERLRAEKALKEKTDMLEIAGRAARFGGWVVDLSTNISIWSDQVAAIHEEPAGFSPTVEMGISYYAPEWRDRITQVFGACAREGVPYDEEMEIITAKGNRRWVRTIGQAARGPDGKIDRVYGSFQDITEVKEAAHALRASEATFRRLVEHSPDGIFLQLDGKFDYINPEALRLFGAASEKEMLGKPVYEIFRQDFHEVISDRIKQLTLENIRVPEIEEFCVRRDGSEFPALVSAVPFEKEGRRGAIVTLRDVTAKKSMEEELLRSQKIESLGVLAGGIAHDFNNMLMGVTANLSLLASKNPPNAEIIEEAISAARSAQALASQLLSFSRGGQPLRKELCLERPLREIYALTVSGSAVKQALVVEEGLWSAEVDENQLKQALGNILINGLQAMPAGGTLGLKAENLEVGPGTPLGLAPGKYLKITVTDTGIGIPEKYLPQVFDPYFTTKPKGHGLGLAMAWTVVKNHGGHIAVSSEQGKGSVFQAYLPASGRCLADCSDKRSEILTGSGRILLLEDEEIVLKAAARMLQELGYSHEVTGDGRETLRRYEEAQKEGRPFDAVIMDLTIPGGMGGGEAGPELRRRFPEAVIIVSSGYSDEAVMSDHKAFGFDAVLPKPYRFEDLAGTLARLLVKN